MYGYDLRFVIKNIAEYCEEYLQNSENKPKIFSFKEIFFGNNKELQKKNNKYYFLTNIYNIINSNQGDIECGQRLLVTIENEIKKIDKSSDLIILNKWKNKLKRILPINNCDTQQVKLILSNSASRKEVHQNYIKLVYFVEKNYFTSELLECYFYIVNSLFDECEAHGIKANFDFEIQNLFSHLYAKNFTRKIKNTENFIVFFSNIIPILIQHKEWLDNFNCTIGSFIYAFPDSIADLSHNFQKIEYDQIYYENTIEVLIQNNQNEIEPLFPEIDLGNLKLQIHSLKHIFKINEKFTLNVLNSMLANTQSVINDLPRCSYYFNKQKIKFDPEDLNYINVLDKVLFKSGFNKETALFFKSYAHQGALVGAASTWFLEFLSKKEFKENISERMLAQKENILWIESIASNVAKIVVIGVFHIVQEQNYEPVIIADNLALIFEVTLTIESNSVINVIKPSLKISNLKERSFFNKILYKELKKGIEYIKMLPTPDTKTQKALGNGDVFEFRMSKHV